MAIIIPSKNIYGDIKNPKIIDNKIERLEVEAKEVVPKNEYEILVYSFQKDIVDKTITDYGINNYVAKDFPNSSYVSYSAHYSSCKLYYFNLDLFIPILLKDNRYISKIYDWEKEKIEVGGVGDFKPSGVQYSLIGNKTTQPLNAYFIFTDGGNSGYAEQFKYGEITIGQNEMIELPNIGGFSIGDVYIGLNVIDETNISVKKNSEEFYRVTGKILIGVEYENALGSTTVPNLSAPSNIKISGEKATYNTKTIEFSIYGDTIGIDIVDKTVYINGQTAKKVHSIDGNELMQVTNYLNTTLENAIDKSFAQTQLQYANGKETATIKCAIADYKDEDGVIAISDKKTFVLPNNSVRAIGTNTQVSSGIYNSKITLSLSNATTYPINVAISYQWTDLAVESQVVTILANETTKTIQFADSSVGLRVNNITVDKVWRDNLPMTFNEYDEVIPMVWGADGKDRPISRYKDGSPKVFKVLGTKPFYDGAVWQELYLQEK